MLTRSNSRKKVIFRVLCPYGRFAGKGKMLLTENFYKSAALNFHFSKINRTGKIQ